MAAASDVLDLTVAMKAVSALLTLIDSCCRQTITSRISSRSMRAKAPGAPRVLLDAVQEAAVAPVTSNAKATFHAARALAAFAASPELRPAILRSLVPLLKWPMMVYSQRRGAAQQHPASSRPGSREGSKEGSREGSQPGTPGGSVRGGRAGLASSLASSLDVAAAEIGRAHV